MNAMAKLQVKDYVGAVADSTNGLISLRDLESNHSIRVKLLWPCICKQVYGQIACCFGRL